MIKSQISKTFINYTIAGAFLHNVYTYVDNYSVMVEYIKKHMPKQDIFVYKFLVKLLGPCDSISLEFYITLLHDLFPTRIFTDNDALNFIERYEIAI